MKDQEFIRQFAAKDRMGALLGVRILSIGQEECVGEYTVSPAHFNPNGILHGGALYTALDSCQGAFVHFNLDPQWRAAATGTATIRYEAPVTAGRVTLRTWLERAEGRKLFVNSEAKSESGQLLASLAEIWITIP